MERAGIPTAVICSDEFGPLARAESQVLGMSALPLIGIPHPLAGNNPSLVEAKGSAIAAEIVTALTSTADELERRYGEQYLRLAERRLQAGALCLDETCAIDPAVAIRN